MFYTYVDQLPMVSDNLILSQGRRFDFSTGYLRKAKMNDEGFRDLIIHDSSRNVTYRIKRTGMLIEYGPEQDYLKVFLKNSQMSTRYVPFSANPSVYEVNSFLVLIAKMNEEYQKRNTFLLYLRYMFLKGPRRVVLTAGVIYAIITLIVLVFG